MGFLLDHLPAHVHLVIASRADPPLPLARLRARGELVEVRAADLRFTDGEAAAYFDGMGLHLDAGDVAALEGRTEGWIAALQLAALSLRGRDDVAAFIEGFAGDDRYVVDYLVEEVLQRQPEDVRGSCSRPRSWTGCPVPCATRSPASPAAARGSRRSTGPTCSSSPSTTAVSGTATTTCSPTCCAPGSSTSTPSGCPTCTAAPVPGTSRPATRRSRSSTRSPPATRTGPPASWRGVIPALTKQRREAQLRRWMEALPEEAFASRPVLANGYVGALMSTGEIRGVESRLRIAESWVEAARAAPAGTLPAGLLVALPDQFRKLPGLDQDPPRGTGPRWSGTCPPPSTAPGRRSTCSTRTTTSGHGAATALMGLASWRQGDVVAAEAAYAETIRRFERVGYVADVLGCAVTMAELQLTLGRLRARGAHLPRRARPRRARDDRARPRAPPTCTSG